ncbi:mannonate dehydratase [Spirochaetia bacterium]|nr:mannonate dehydratase [Spirochaetia bacterium]GHU31845.1 mannonate dehydratase [Spirochaetia bacterium]
MVMTMRWFGPGFDPVTLEQIRQVPGVTGVISTLYNKQPGEEWKSEEITALKNAVEKADLQLSGIESVNIHDAIKTASPDRDRYIATYITTLERLGQAGIHLVCYNFMPVFDWTRTELAKVRPDGSTTMAYDQSIIDTIDPDNMQALIERQSNGFMLAGWEPERLAKLGELFALYRDVDEKKLFENLCYFLNCIMPVCDTYDINMAIHPDDPAWPVFGLPRIVTGKKDLLHLMEGVKNPHNGVTLCTGSLGTNPKNDIPDIIGSLNGRIHFAHIRNLLHTAPGKFEESAHLSSDGSMDIFAIVKALHDIGFEGPIRPDHGRNIWGEKGMPGYGLYDRALGAAYLNGLWEAVEKNS